jgi:hypothetical protein
MKKTMMLFTGLAFLLNGCTGAGLQSDQVKQIAVQSSARMLGYKIAESDRGLIDPAKTFCKLVTSGNIDDAVVETAKSYLLRNTTPDSLLTATLMDLVELVKVSAAGTEIKTIYNHQLVRIAALYVLDGITIYEKGNCREQDTGVALYEKPTKEIDYDC